MRGYGVLGVEKPAAMRTAWVEGVLHSALDAAGVAADAGAFADVALRLTKSPWRVMKDQTFGSLAVVTRRSGPRNRPPPAVYPSIRHGVQAPGSALSGPPRSSQS